MRIGIAVSYPYKVALKYQCPICAILKDCDLGINIMNQPTRRFFLKGTKPGKLGCRLYQER